MGVADNFRFQRLEREAADQRLAGARQLVREAKAPPSVRGRIIYAQVNEGGGVSSGDTSFAFDNARKVVGALPPDGEGTAENQYAQTYADGDWVFLFYDADADLWLTERGGTAGSQVLKYELTADKTYADLAVLAKPVDAAGLLDSGADAFYVVDYEHQHWGLAAYTDGDTEAESFTGYRGACVRFTDDWASTGIPGFHIIAQENPAQFVLVDLAEDVGATTADEAKCNYVGSTDVHGRPFSGRRPRLEDDASPGNFTALDDLEIAQTAKSGSRWILKWEEAAEYYIFWRPMHPASGGGGKFFLTISSIGVAGFSDPTFTPGTGDAYALVSNADGTWTVDDSEEVTLYNSDLSEAVDSGKIVQVKYVDGYPIVDVEPCD